MIRFSIFCFILNLVFTLAHSQSTANTSQVSPNNVTANKLLRGQSAIDYLNTRSTIQSINRFQSVSKLKELLLKNADLAIDTRSNRPVYVCKGIIPEKGSIKTQNLPAANSPDPLASNVTKNAQGLPLLSSRPGSSKTIFLDFDGCSIPAGSLWNNGSAFTNSYYDPAHDGATFSASEQKDIIAIWRAVSEDYAPFDVDVTTIDRGVDRIIENFQGDQQYGIHVCIGGSYSDWFKEEAGGVAYTYSFGYTKDLPAFVFSIDLYDGYAKYVWEATSHEVGHTFGMNHDGKGDFEYYEGHGNWAPILGVAYDRAVSQFSNGDYTGATNTENDFDMIGQYLKLVGDDHGNSISNATLLSNKTSLSGLIGVNDIADYFKINVQGGQVVIKADVLVPWGSESRANLDLVLSVYNSTNKLVATTSPTDTLSASLALSSLARGTYYISVAKSGKVSSDGGYSSYGSVGQYALSGSFVEMVSVVSSSSRSASTRSTTRSSSTPLTRSSVKTTSTRSSLRSTSTLRTSSRTSTSSRRSSSSTRRTSSSTRPASSSTRRSSTSSRSSVRPTSSTRISAKTTSTRMI